MLGGTLNTRSHWRHFNPFNPGIFYRQFRKTTTFLISFIPLFLPLKGIMVNINRAHSFTINFF